LWTCPSGSLWSPDLGTTTSNKKQLPDKKLL
jgi:hypothetical protein